MNQTALPVPNPDDWLSIKAVLRALGISRSTLYAWQSEGIIRTYTVAGRPAFWRAEVDEIRQARARIGKGPDA